MNGPRLICSAGCGREVSMLQPFCPACRRMLGLVELASERDHSRQAPATSREINPHVHGHGTAIDVDGLQLTGRIVPLRRPKP